MIDEAEKESSSWWLNHVGEMAVHHRRVYERHELRSRYVLALIGLGIAGLRFSVGPLDGLSIGALEYIIIVFWLVCVSCSVTLLLATLAPLGGSRYFKGSFEYLIYMSLTSDKTISKTVCRLLGLSHAVQEFTPFKLSERFRDGRKDLDWEAGSRRVIAEYLFDEFKTDLEWWVSQELDVRQYDINKRQVFWYWSNKEAGKRKGLLLEAAISLFLRFTMLTIIVWLIYSIGNALLSVGCSRAV